jgi:hypothetical protein
MLVPMAAEVWGTCAVNDHLREQPFLRELLLFDRLVVPYPSVTMSVADGGTGIPPITWRHGFPSV